MTSSRYPKLRALAYEGVSHGYDAMRQELREALEAGDEMMRAIEQLLAQPMPNGLVDLHGGGALSQRLNDARSCWRLGAGGRHFDMTGTEVRCEPTRYTISAVPESEDPYGGSAWALQVEYAGHGRWAVRHHSHCFPTSGEWGGEIFPSEHDALAWARQMAPKVVVNGMTPADVIAHAKQRGRLDENEHREPV